MLLLALSLMVQDVDLPPVSPGLCKATADKLEPVINSVRGALDEETRKLRAGEKSDYTAERLQRMMSLLEADAANVVKVKRRYANAAANADELEELNAMHSPDWADYVKACAA